MTATTVTIKQSEYTFLKSLEKKEQAEKAQQAHDLARNKRQAEEYAKAEKYANQFRKQYSLINKATDKISNICSYTGFDPAENEKELERDKEALGKLIIKLQLQMKELETAVMSLSK